MSTGIDDPGAVRDEPEDRSPEPGGDVSGARVVTNHLMNEFVQLNRRRLFGLPPLCIPDLERWQQLRQQLEDRLGKGLEGILASVERRAHLRFPTHLKVRFGSGEDLRTACLENISEGGIFIATEEPLPVDTNLRLSLCSPHGAVEMAGEVAWVRSVAGEGGPAGMGVRFGGLTTIQREQIAEILAGISPGSGNA